MFLFGLYWRLSLRKVWWLILSIFFFAMMPGIRANEFLTFLNLCATLSLLMLLAHELAGTPTFLMKLHDYLEKIKLYEKIKGEDKEVLRELFQNQKDRLQKNSADWRSANVSRARALRLLNGF